MLILLHYILHFKGALSGGISSLIFMAWFCLRTQTLIASGDLTFPEKPVTTEGCHYSFSPKQSSLVNMKFDPSVNATDVTHTEYVLYLLMTELYFPRLKITSKKTT